MTNMQKNEEVKITRKSNLKKRMKSEIKTI